MTFNVHFPPLGLTLHGLTAEQVQSIAAQFDTAETLSPTVTLYYEPTRSGEMQRVVAIVSEGEQS